MKNFLSILIILAVIFPLLALAQAQQQPVGQTDPYGLGQTAQQAGLVQSGQTPPTVSQIIGFVINAVLGLIGVIYLSIIIYSGFQWMTAGGNEDTITKAKNRLIQSTIGLVIVFSAFIITNFVIFRILDITGIESIF